MQSPLSLSRVKRRRRCQALFRSTEQGRQYLVCEIFLIVIPQISQSMNFRSLHRFFAFDFLTDSRCRSRWTLQSLPPWTAGTFPHSTQIPFLGQLPVSNVLLLPNMSPIAFGTSLRLRELEDGSASPDTGMRIGSPPSHPKNPRGCLIPHSIDSYGWFFKSYKERLSLWS